MSGPRTLAVAALAALVAACSREAPSPEPVRPVVLARVATGALQDVAVFPGDVRPRHEADLAFRIAGKLVERNVDVGASVRRGQPLARLDPADVALQAQAQQAAVAAATTEHTFARAEFERFESLYRQRFVSASALDQKRNAMNAAAARLEQARATLAVTRNQATYATLVAPADGVITAVAAEVGQVVAVGQGVMKLAETGEREVAIAVPEHRLDELRAATHLAVALWADPRTRYPARVREIAPAVDPATRTFAVRVAVPGADASRDVGEPVAPRVRRELAEPHGGVGLGERVVEQRAVGFLRDARELAAHRGVGRLVRGTGIGEQRGELAGGVQLVGARGQVADVPAQRLPRGAPHEAAGIAVVADEREAVGCERPREQREQRLADRRGHPRVHAVRDDVVPRSAVERGEVALDEAHVRESQFGRGVARGADSERRDVAAGERRAGKRRRHRQQVGAVVAADFQHARGGDRGRVEAEHRRHGRDVVGVRQRVGQRVVGDRVVVRRDVGVGRGLGQGSVGSAAVVRGPDCTGACGALRPVRRYAALPSGSGSSVVACTGRGAPTGQCSRARSGRWSLAVRASGVACTRSSASMPAGSVHSRSSATSGRRAGNVAGAGDTPKCACSHRSGRPHRYHSLTSPVSTVGCTGSRSSAFSRRFTCTRRSPGISPRCVAITRSGRTGASTSTSSAPRGSRRGTARSMVCASSTGWRDSTTLP